MTTTLKESNFKIVLLGAGSSLVTERIQRQIKVDDSLVNELAVQNGLLISDIKVNVSFYNKDKALRHILRKFNAKMVEYVAVGNDETLTSLFEKVSLGIAFNPKEKNVEKTHRCYSQEQRLTPSSTTSSDTKKILDLLQWQVIFKLKCMN